MSLIECTIKRPREVTLGRETYHFEKDDQGRYTAEVTDEDHVDRLLEIRCYREVSASGKKQRSPAPEKDQKPQESEASKQVDTRPEGAALQTQSASTSGIPITGQGLGTIQPDETGDDGDGEEDEGGGEALDRAKLAAEYEAKFKKKPHHSQSAERIKQLLEEGDD